MSAQRAPYSKVLIAESHGEDKREIMVKEIDHLWIDVDEHEGGKVASDTTCCFGTPLQRGAPRGKGGAGEGSVSHQRASRLDPPPSHVVTATTAGEQLSMRHRSRMFN